MLDSPVEATALRRRHAALAARLSRLNSHFTLIALAMDWAWILAAIILHHLYPSPLVYLLSCLIIASRQHAFLILTHEATHFRTLKHRYWNDFLTDILAAYPVFFDTDIYRNTHFKHHEFLNSDLDPDWVRKAPLKEWQFPKPLRAFGAFWLKYVLWKAPLEWLYAIHHFSGLSHGLRLRKLGFWLIVLSALFFTDQIASFVLYWLIPYFLIFPALQRLRSIAEHFGLDNTHELNQTRDVSTNAIERFILGPHHVGLHLVHHLFSSVPFYNLPKLHAELLKDPDFQRLSHQNTSYLWPSKASLLQDLISTRQQLEKKDAA